MHHAVYSIVMSHQIVLQAHEGAVQLLAQRCIGEI